MLVFPFCCSFFSSAPRKMIYKAVLMFPLCALIPQVLGGAQQIVTAQDLKRQHKMDSVLPWE